MSSTNIWKHLEPKQRIFTSYHSTLSPAEQMKSLPNGGLNFLSVILTDCRTSIICTLRRNQNFTRRSLFRPEPPPSPLSRRRSWPDWVQWTKPTESPGLNPQLSASRNGQEKSCPFGSKPWWNRQLRHHCADAQPVAMPAFEERYNSTLRMTLEANGYWEPALWARILPGGKTEKECSEHI